MTVNFTAQVNLTATCNTCNKQARRKETIVNGSVTSALIKFRNDLKIHGWEFHGAGYDECAECFEKRLRLESRI